MRSRWAFKWILLVATSLPSILYGASFNCSVEKLSAVEKNICDDRVLSKMDDGLSSLYKLLIRQYDGELYGRPSIGRKRLISSQRSWLVERNRCKELGCLRGSYVDRITELGSLLEELTYKSSFTYLAEIIKKGIGIGYVQDVSSNTLITQATCSDSWCPYWKAFLVQFSGRDYPPSGLGPGGADSNYYIAYIETDKNSEVTKAKYVYDFPYMSEGAIVYLHEEPSGSPERYVVGYQDKDGFYPAFSVVRQSRQLVYERIGDIQKGEMSGNPHLY